MNTTLTVGARLSALLFILLFCSTGFAGSTKVEICHVPPDDPENFHTIRINSNALPSHLAHGDLGKPCNSVCATVCDDGDACTIDYEGDCEQNGCSVNPQPVDCDDGLACTTDSCEPANGCINSAVVCDALDTCNVSTCAPDTGECVDSPIVCDEGFECNPESDVCEEDGGNVNSCPCFDAALLQDLGTIDPSNCGDNFPASGVAAVYYTDFNSLACSGIGCGTNIDASCGFEDAINGISYGQTVTDNQNMDCRQLIDDSCPPPAP